MYFRKSVILLILFFWVVGYLCFAFYTAAVVDGLRVRIREVSFGDMNNTIEKTIDLAENIENALNALVMLPADMPISSINISLYNEYDLKAYTYNPNADICYYSTSTGIKTVIGIPDPYAQADYDYMHYDFIYITTAKSPTSQNDYFNETIILNKDILLSTDESVDIKLLVDIFRVAVFWDGAGQRPEPFWWFNNNNIPTNSFYPDNVPNFGICYIPFFISLNDPHVQSETYFLHNDQTKLQGNLLDNIEWCSKYKVVTLVFANDGMLYTGRVRGSDDDFGALNPVTIYQFIRTEIPQTGPVYRLVNCAWFGEESIIIEEFMRLADYDTIGQSSLSNGSTLYYRRVER